MSLIQCWDKFAIEILNPIFLISSSMTKEQVNTLGDFIKNHFANQQEVKVLDVRTSWAE